MENRLAIARVGRGKREKWELGLAAEWVCGFLGSGAMKMFDTETVLMVAQACQCAKGH